MDARNLLPSLAFVTLLLSTVGVNVAYRRQGGAWLRRFDESHWGVPLRELVTFVVMVGIPFVALITGAAGLDLFALAKDLTDPTAIAGFTFLNWVRGVGVSFAAVACVLLVLWVAAHTTPRGQPWGLGCLAARDALYDEVHWVFYRAAPALLLADPYWGAMVGTVVVLVEWACHPQFPAMLSTAEGREYLVLRLARLCCSSFLYLAVGNLWLMILADLAIQYAGSRIFSSHQTKSLATQQPDITTEAQRTQSSLDT